ncbi:MAG: ABC transporter substrate-binding protein [Armatimonadota bacterium]|nr:ABC transporter substrate-binding protein [bacterium]
MRIYLSAMLTVLLLCVGCNSQDCTNATRTTPRNEIIVWHSWGGAQKELLSRVIDEFNRSHPNIHARALFTPIETGSSQKFFTAVAANRPPDVIFTDGMQTIAYAEQGALLPLDKYAGRSGVKPSDYFAPSWNQNYYKGHVWGLTYCADPNFALAWNKKVFREAGLDPNKPPRTIEELDKYNDKLTVKKDGRIVRMGIVPWGQYGTANSLFTWGWAFKGRFYNDKTHKVTLNDPGVFRAFAWMVNYAKKFDVTKINAFSSGFGSRDQDPFYTGQIAMKCMHISCIEDIKQYAPNLDYGVAGMPAPKGGELNSSWIGGWCLAIPKGSKKADAAWEFIRWCCHDPKGTSIVGRTQGMLPGYRKSPYFKEVENKPIYCEFVKILKQCRHQRPVMPAMSFYSGAIEKATDYALYGRKTPKQALDDATRDTQIELDVRLAGK